MSQRIKIQTHILKNSVYCIGLNFNSQPNLGLTLAILCNANNHH